ncbi:hypothetical protein TNCV_2964681 [Trichonephila clavipes]|nr:hypothetical protein TNCV_2964681 [Trichonephila clavipes]
MIRKVLFLLQDTFVRVKLLLMPTSVSRLLMVSLDGTGCLEGGRISRPELSGKFATFVFLGRPDPLRYRISDSNFDQPALKNTARDQVFNIALIRLLDSRRRSLMQGVSKIFLSESFASYQTTLPSPLTVLPT